MKAVYQDTTIAESDDTVLVEGNHYFPPESVRKEYLRESAHTSTCPWKGEAHYFDVVVGDHTLEDAAWVYPEPKEAAKHIANHLAFWKDVSVTQ